MIGEESYTRMLEKKYEIAIEVLEDVWNQFAIPGKNEKLWAGGLSTLEDVEEILIKEGKV